MAFQDKIGREDIVNKVCGLVDSLKEDDHFCLAINGSWGSGKSCVLQMIQEELSSNDNYFVIKYDAWKNSFYSDPLISILSCIVEGINKRCPKVGKKGRFKNVVKALLESDDPFLSGEALKWRSALKRLGNIIKALQSPVDTTIFKDFKSYQSLLEQTVELLNEITNLDGSYNVSKVIILVDEIDRCLPDEQLKILERLHHLFDAHNCAVIVAMNQDCIAKTVQTTYGTDGHEYLRKFFDFTFKLPVSANLYLGNLLNDFTERLTKIGMSKDEAQIPVKLAYGCLAYGNAHVLDKTDNRELSRYYDCVLKVCNDFGWERMKNPYYIFFVLVALFIRRIISSTFLDEGESF